LLRLIIIIFHRTVDKENPPDSKSDFKIKTLAKTASDLNFSCKIDTVSEAEIVDAVLSINYSIDNLISNILAGVKEFKLSYHKILPLNTRNRHRRNDIPSNSDLDIPLLHYLLIDSPSLLSDDTRDYVVEIILHNLVSSLVHKHFFKGGHFFGVGSEGLHEYLETMFLKLVASGKNCFIMNISSVINNLSLFRKLGSYRNSALAFDEYRSHIPNE
jgi:hypothetical protein